MMELKGEEELSSSIDSNNYPDGIEEDNQVLFQYLNFSFGYFHLLFYCCLFRCITL
jgi:hypothetical protein